MIYILADSNVEATAFAAVGLGISARDMGWKTTCVTSPKGLPPKFTDEDQVRATPIFWMAMDPRHADEAWSSDPMHRRIRREASMIATAVRQRGGVVLPPYDVPDAMDRESVEAWLDEA